MISTTLVCGLVLGLGACLAFSSDAAAQDAAEKPRVELDTTAGKIVLEVDPQKAPITADNFLKYVDAGFYDNLIFHRVIPDFMIQTGGLDDQMKDKREGQRAPIKNESGNGLTNTRGSIAMARTNDPNSATSQFFINLKDNGFLDAGAGYAVFGKVVEGMDVVDEIAKTQTTTKAGHQDVPAKPIYIKSAKRVGK